MNDKQNTHLNTSDFESGRSLGKVEGMECEREYSDRERKERRSVYLPIVAAVLFVLAAILLFVTPASPQEAAAPTPPVATTPAPESRDISETSALKLENLQLRNLLAVQQQQAANQAVVASRAAIQVAVEALWTELEIEEKDRGNWNVDLAGRKATKKAVVVTKEE